MVNYTSVRKKHTPELYIINTIKNNDSVTGLRLFDLGNNELADVKIDSVIKKIYKDNSIIKNLQFYSNLYSYADNFDDFREYIIDDIEYGFIKLSEDYNRMGYRIALLKDDEGVISVREDGILQYDLTSSIIDGKETYYDVKNMYILKSGVEFSNRNCIVEINDSIYKDKLNEIKNRSIAFKKQADIIVMSGICKGINLNNLGEVYIDSGQYGHGDSEVKIEMPTKFNKLVRSRDDNRLYSTDIHIVFNKNLKIIGDKVFYDASKVTLDTPENCFVEEIGYKAFRNVELASDNLGNEWVFRVPCYFHNSSFLRTIIKLESKPVSLNIDRIERYAFAYAQTNNVIDLHSTKDSYGIIESKAFMGAKLFGGIILGDNIELYDSIFENCELPVVILNSNNIKVHDNCKPFNGCKIDNVIVIDKCNKIPDNLFNSANIEKIDVNCKKVNIGKQAFANTILNKNNNIFKNEIGVIDDEAFMNLEIQLTDYEELIINAESIKNGMFKGSRLETSHLVINCGNIGDGLFKDCELKIDSCILPKLSHGMFEGATIKQGVYKLLQGVNEIPDRVFKNSIAYVGFVNDILNNKLTYIGREAFKDFKDMHEAYYGETLNITSNVIYESAFENCTFYYNVQHIHITCQDIRAKAFRGLRVTYNKDVYNNVNLELRVRKVGKAAFNDLQNILEINIKDKINNETGILEIDDDNFHIEPDATSLSCYDCESENSNLLDKFMHYMYD